MNVHWVRCPACGSSEVIRLPEDWQDQVSKGATLEIVGCGNPWHYATQSLGDSPDFDHLSAHFEPSWQGNRRG